MPIRLLVCLACLVFGVSSAAQEQGQDLKLRDFQDLSRLTVSGAASVGGGGVLTLTPSQDWTAGSVFSSQQISTTTFSTFFSFRISEPGGGGADGIAMVMQTVSASLGEVGGGMGYQNVPNSLAIEFDTWRNGWDADDNHLGLLVNGNIEHQNFPAVPLEQKLEDGAPWYVWVDYDGAVLSLRLAREKRRPDQASFEHFVDIPDLLQSETAFVGFASATGAARAKHEILEWTYLERFAPEAIDETQKIASTLEATQSVDLDITFEFNSDVLTNEGGAQLALFVDAVRQLYPQVPPLSILGHTDASGSDSYNLALSNRRAASVKRALEERHGFDASALLSEGRGERELKFPDQPEADGNRRVEIRVTGAAPSPSASRAQSAPSQEAVALISTFPSAIRGVYAPDGDCALWPRVTVEEARVEFYSWEGGDSLFLNKWRDCSDCLPDIPAGPGEVRVSPFISHDAEVKGPIFLISDGLLIAEPRGDVAHLPELAEMVQFGALARCDVSQIAAVAALHPTAESRWRSFDTDRRAGAGYCPVLDTSGPHQMCFGLGCGYGERINWSLGVTGAPVGFSPATDAEIKAEVLVDGAVVGRMTFAVDPGRPDAGFRAPFNYETHGVALVQLRKGNMAELRLSSAGQQAAVLMPLRGSSKALDGINQICGERYLNATPANRPDRFLGQQGPTQPEAEALAREALSDMLAEMRAEANAPQIDVVSGWLIEPGDGWRFILTEVGASTYHFGIGAFGGFVLAAPPGEPFRLVGPSANAMIVWLDREQRYQGWPRLIFQSARGIDPPFHAWRWNGSEYVYDRKIEVR